MSIASISNLECVVFLLLLFLSLLRIEYTCYGSRVVVTYFPRLPNNPFGTLQQEKQKAILRVSNFIPGKVVFLLESCFQC